MFVFVRVCGHPCLVGVSAAVAIVTLTCCHLTSAPSSSISRARCSSAFAPAPPSMSSAAGRKKSVVSTAGLQIETPVANNTFLNKSAAQSTSLYQQCTQLRARLMRIYDFSPYFAINAPSETRTSTDPVTQLWDCFALGVPLCFLYNLLPNVSPISSIDTNPEAIDPADEKSIKKAIVHFAMAIANSTDLFDQSEQFRATQLLDRKSTEGFVKVCSFCTFLSLFDAHAR